MVKLGTALAVSLAILATESGIGACDRVFVCYYGSWATYRPGNGKYDVENIDPQLCTHLIYAFAGLADNRIVSLDAWNDLTDGGGKGGYQRFVNLKQKNQQLKTLIAIGGWNEGSLKFSTMAKSPATRAIFVQSVVAFLDRHRFDGLDVDWEFPAARGGSSEDKANFVTLLRELKQAFQPRGYLLTAAVSAGKGIIDAGYDVPGISQHLDLIHTMTYDFHGSWEKYVHHNSPLGVHPLDISSPLGQANQNQLNNVKFAVEYWLQRGAPKEKLVMGIPLYGQGFTLDRPQDGNGLYLPASQPSNAGPYTRTAGSLGFNEICEIQMNQGGNFRRFWVDEISAPYAMFQTNQWIGYDDIDSIQRKVDFINQMGLRGAMAWSIETDDFTGKCNLGRFPDKKNPLLKTIRAGISSPITTINFIKSTSGDDAMWAFECDWVNNDIGGIQSTAELCGMKCKENPQCTHFTHTDWEGGTCWLKNGCPSAPPFVKKGVAAVCGFILGHNEGCTDVPT